MINSKWSVFIRAVNVNALIYEIIVAEINAIKYFNAVNTTLFTSGVRYPLTRNRRVPAVSKLGETELKMERAEGLLGGKFLLKRQNDGTIVKTKTNSGRYSYIGRLSCYNLNKHEDGVT